MTAKLIFLAGSARKDSLNKKLAKAAAQKAEELGAQITYIDLADYPMPIYCEDLEAEQGLPENAKKLKALFAEHDGFLISSPEYNSTFSPLLKNTFDWMSRPSEKGEAPHPATKGKTVALMAATPGALGGIRVMVPLRLWFSNIGSHVIPTQFCLGKAHESFDGEDNYTGNNPLFEATLKEFIETAQALS